MRTYPAEDFVPASMEAAIGRISTYASAHGLTPQEVADTFNAGIVVMSCAPPVRPEWVNRTSKSYWVGPD